MAGRRRTRHEMTWPKFRFVLGLACLLMGLMFAGFESLAHRNGTLWVVLGAVGAWLFWIHLPQGDRRRRLQHVHTLGDLLACTPREFERRVADILAETGYRSVSHVGGSGDLAADLTCRDHGGKSVVVQCKRYTPGHRVGSPDVQQFIGMMTVHHKAEHGLFVTTSEFTGPAVELARKHRVSLIGGRELTDLVHRIQSQREDRVGAKAEAH